MPLSGIKGLIESHEDYYGMIVVAITPDDLKCFDRIHLITPRWCIVGWLNTLVNGMVLVVYWWDFIGVH